MTHPKLLIDSHFYGMVVGNSSVDAVVRRLVLEGFHASVFLCRLGYRYHQLASSCLLDVQAALCTPELLLRHYNFSFNSMQSKFRCISKRNPFDLIILT